MKLWAHFVRWVWVYGLVAVLGTLVIGAEWLLSGVNVGGIMPGAFMAVDEILLESYGVSREVNGVPYLRASNAESVESCFRESGSQWNANNVDLYFSCDSRDVIIGVERKFEIVDGAPSCNPIKMIGRSTRLLPFTSYRSVRLYYAAPPVESRVPHQRSGGRASYVS